MVLLLGLFITCRMLAWDEYSHSYITQLAISYIKNPELKALLEKHNNRLLSGCWYPDWERFSGGKIPPVGNHSREHFGDFFLQYLAQDSVKQQDNYEDLIAFCLGIFAHTIEDQWYDLILYKYLETKDEGIYKDQHTGFLNIQLHQLHRKTKTEKYYPIEDLLKVYNMTGYFDNHATTNQAIKQQIRLGTRRQHILMKTMSVVSFFTSHGLQKKMPWAAEHMMEAPGGFYQTAQATAAYWEALYKIINNEEVSQPVFAAWDELEGRINLIMPWSVHPQRLLESGACFIDDAGNRIMAIPWKSLYPSEVITQFIPESPLDREQQYCFILPKGSYFDQQDLETQEYQMKFKAIQVP